MATVLDGVESDIWRASLGTMALAIYRPYVWLSSDEQLPIRQLAQSVCVRSEQLAEDGLCV